MEWHGYKLRITRRSNATKLILRHTTGSDIFNVTIPTHCPKRELISFLQKQEEWLARELSANDALHPPTLHKSEKALLLGDIVTLGADGIPSGNGFLRLRDRLLLEQIQTLLPIWQTRMGVQAASIRFRTMRSRWGSCQPQTRAININRRLGAMPPACIEYVLVHELCHLIHPDHSPRFHAAMSRFLPDWAERKERLRQLGLMAEAYEAGLTDLTGGDP